MESIIIGIHGLRNKPQKYRLTQWWKQAMEEGFACIGLPRVPFTFRMAYWAQYMHEKPQLESITDPEDPQYLPEPYVPDTGKGGPREPSTFSHKLYHGIHKQIMQLLAGKKGFMNIHAVSDIILHRMFTELDIYYHHDLKDELGSLRPAKELIRGELASLLYKHRKKNIMLIAHSMGAIIAYDVLTLTLPDVPVHTFVTIGAPLGFPVLMNQIRLERGRGAKDRGSLPAPPGITKRWLNFADLEDVTCLNYNLRNQYVPNARGVRPFDQIVFNNYEHQGERNPHKAYGYLRTADMARALYHFLRFDNADLWQRIKWVFNKPAI